MIIKRAESSKMSILPMHFVLEDLTFYKGFRISASRRARRHVSIADIIFSWKPPWKLSLTATRVRHLLNLTP